MIEKKSNIVGSIQEELLRLSEEARNPSTSATSRRKVNLQLRAIVSTILASLSEIDPVKAPLSVFDPGNPNTISFFVALAMTAQERRPLATLDQFYGAGVYAIYYKGKFTAYAPIRKTETPIYVGQAISKADTAKRSPRDQGTVLFKRLMEHRKNIERAKSTLNIADFDYRALVVQPGWETVAENYLIALFRPIWNKEVKLVYGIGKHGDSSETRKNKRSPWDTLHPARKWATTEHKKTTKIIKDELADHFKKHKAYKNFTDVLDHFRSEMNQV